MGRPKTLIDDYQQEPLWEGPSKLITLRTTRAVPMKSLLKSTYRDPTGIGKQNREGLIHLDRLGFEADEHVLPVHGGPEKSVLQYNPDHYPEWKSYLKDIKVAKDESRDKLFTVGGFGENIAVQNMEGETPMDERTMCIGDLVGFCRTSDVASASGQHRPQARIRVTGPRLPCYKLNHRFGVPNMSQRTQDKFWTGWLYSTASEGEAQVGDVMVLLERPFPQWPVARIQHYLFRDPQNLNMIQQALDTLGDRLVWDVRGLFQNRLTKGTEDMSNRLQGEEQKDNFTKYRLRQKIKQTARVTEFVFERVEKLSKNSTEFLQAQSGSHVRLRLKPDNSSIIRPYSVVSGNTNSFHLGIALADQSKGGSLFLHHSLKVGDLIDCSDKFSNTFPLQEQNVKEHVFLAGGIGITAFLDHMRHCQETKQRFHLHYMIRNKEDYAFKSLIESMTDPNSPKDSPRHERTSSMSSRSGDIDHLCNLGRLTLYISAEGQRCDLKALLRSLAGEENTHIYVCGSEKMSDSIRESAAILQIPNTRIHFEDFSVDGTGDPFVAKLGHSGKKIEVSARQTLLEALREVGLDIPSSCETGNCGTCKVRVKCGRIQHKGTALAEDEKAGYDGREEGEMLSCVSRGIGSISIVT